ncbi:hypothetical protein [Nonomuraea sp. NPDC049504]
MDKIGQGSVHPAVSRDAQPGAGTRQAEVENQAFALQTNLHAAMI